MARKPQIILSSLDVDRIEALLAAIPASVFPGKADLQAELDRADVVPPEEIPPNVVTMNSTVQFSILETGKEFCLTLVYPPRRRWHRRPHLDLRARGQRPAGPGGGRRTGLARAGWQVDDGAGEGHPVPARKRGRAAPLMPPLPGSGQHAAWRDARHQ